MNGIDREHAEAEAVGREFPGWTAWVAIDNLWRARAPVPDPKPGDVVTGENPDDLRDMIRAWIRNHP